MDRGGESVRKNDHPAIARQCRYGLLDVGVVVDGSRDRLYLERLGGAFEWT
jgi:hypothetical protein